MQAVTLGAVGDSFVGKSLLLVSYTANYVYQEYRPTALDCHWTNVVVDGILVDLTTWDNSGSSQYIDLRPLSYPQTDAFLICFSLKSRKTFDNVERVWIPEIRKHASHNPCILVGCKNDNCLDVLRNPKKVTSAEARAMAMKIGALKYVETSALNQTGLTDCFTAAIQAALQYRNMQRRDSL